MLIQWQDAWRVGNSAIDYDHQMLVNITNQLWDLKQQPTVAHEDVRRILQQLVDYVKRHFRREEAIFKHSDYPDKDAHVAMHGELTRVVQDIARAYEYNPDLLDLDEIMEFLRNWLMEHILKHDMGYRDYIDTDAGQVTKGGAGTREVKSGKAKAEGVGKGQGKARKHRRPAA